MSIMLEALDAFGAAMAEAEKHRTTLKKRFGLDDRTIGTLTLARRKRSSPMSEYKKAVLAAAKLRLESKQ